MSGPAESHVREIDREMMADAQANLTKAWRIVRGQYDDDIAEMVDTVVGGGGLSYLDITAMNMAEYMHLLKKRGTKGYATREVTERLIAISKHLCKLTELMGGTNVGKKKVAVPEGVFGFTSDDVDPELDILNDDTDSGALN